MQKRKYILLLFVFFWNAQRALFIVLIYIYIMTKIFNQQANNEIIYKWEKILQLITKLNGNYRKVTYCQTCKLYMFTIYLPLLGCKPACDPYMYRPSYTNSIIVGNYISAPLVVSLAICLNFDLHHCISKVISSVCH